MKLLSGLSIALLYSCLFLPDAARAQPSVASSPYLVSVESESGIELPTFHHAGQTFVLGRYGDRYNIRVRNRTGRRVEAVVSVDGRDVVSGSVGDFVHERGHLIDAYDEVVIEGFRQNWEEVAAFRFSSPTESYSARMGTKENVGVIGVAVFPERPRPAIMRPMPVAPRSTAARPTPEYGLGTDDSAASMSKSKAGGASEFGDLRARSGRSSATEAERDASPRSTSRDNLGTQYGESIDSSVREVAFQRADRTHPAQVIALRYDDRDGLVARGILVDPARTRQACGPQAFPNSRFAPRPPPYGD
jgi:hypothetical protein